MSKQIFPFKPEITIDQRKIGKFHPPYVIAELSGNHQGRLDQALSMIEAAASSGVDAIKLQTYRPDTITLNHDSAEFCLTDGLWQGQTLYQLYQQAYTPWEWHPQLFEKAKSLGITLFSSPFDKTAVDLLESLDCPAYKIASFELVDIPLIEYIAATQKPIIMSTGMATEEEIYAAVQAIANTGNNQLAILHCVSGYPTPIEHSHLNTISDLATRYQLPVGLSDHTKSTVTSIAATALGGSIIEKHFMLNGNDEGVDAAFSLCKDEFSVLVSQVNDAWHALGQVNYQLKPSEQDNRQFRRSLYACSDIKAGEAITESNIKSVRPGFGLPPKYYKELLGKVAKVDIDFGTPLSWQHFMDEKQK